MGEKNLEEIKSELDEKSTDLDNRIEKAEKARKDFESAKENLIASHTMRPMGGAGSDEQRAMTHFGCNHVKQLININTNDFKYNHVPLELKQLVLNLKRDVDVARMTAQICLGGAEDKGDAPVAVKGVLDTYFGRNVLASRLKAFGSTTPGAGDEWVPTAVSSQFIEEFELERQVMRQFRAVNMPSNPFDLPVQTSVTTARIQAEKTALTEANFGTAKITLDAIKLAEFMCLPEELNEDSAPAILSLARQEVVEAELRAVETAIMNGDSDGTHQDSDTQAGSADLAEKAWDGLRKLALANSANGATVDFTGAAATLAKLRDMRAAMGKFGVNPRELVWIVSPKIYNQMLALPEVSTVEQFGPQATILRGALAALDGIPIIISEFVRDDLNAAGVHDGVTTNLSIAHLVNHRRYFLGVRRPIRTRVVMDLPSHDRWLLGAWWRGDFEGHAQSATEVSTVLGFNIA